MSVIIKTLENIDYKTIHTSFQNAFSDYLVDISYMTLDVLTKRFKKNGFQPSLSVGVFENEKLQGFTVVGSGYFFGKQSAFDIMTGLVKEYRGKGLANEMFDLILEKMKEHALKTFYLEVLQENKSAIKAYSKAGFKKTRGFDCYSLKVGNLREAKNIRSIVYIDEISLSDIDNYSHFLDWEPSWENHFESIKRIPDRVNIIIAKTLGKVVGLCIYYPTLKWILTFAVDPNHRRKGVASAMLEYIRDSLPVFVREIKLLNVQDDDLAMKKFLIASGFELITAQYEMEFEMN